MPARPRVFVARVDDYDPARIRSAVSEGIAFVGPRLQGNVVAKADWSYAHRRRGSAAYTRPELVKGALDSLLAREPDLFLVFSGTANWGRSARRMARKAWGHPADFRRQGFLALPRVFRGRVSICPTDEARYYRYQLSVGRRMSHEERRSVDEIADGCRYWDRVATGWELYHADGVLLFPKLKSNHLAHGLGGAVALQGAGFLRGAVLLDGHDQHHSRRIADLLELTDPDLIVTDAIDVGVGGSPDTQAGHRLGAVLVANNAVAHDVVCAHLLGLDPGAIPHLRLASSRGYGPLDLDAIDVEGGEQLPLFTTRVRGFGVSGARRVDDFSSHFERELGVPFPLEVCCGDPYQGSGAHGLLLDWLYTSYDLPDARERMKRWPRASVLVGDCEAQPTSRRVFLVGDAAIASFRSQAAYLQPLLPVPTGMERWLGALAGLHRYRLPDGRTGLAMAIPGSPPSRPAMDRAFFVGSLGRIRSALTFEALGGLLAGLITTLLRRHRNRDGIRVVHARKIQRFVDRSWREPWLGPAALTLRKERGEDSS